MKKNILVAAMTFLMSPMASALELADLTRKMAVVKISNEVYTLNFTSLGPDVFAHLESERTDIRVVSPVKNSDNTNYADISYFDPKTSKLDLRFRFPASKERSSTSPLIQVWFVIDLLKDYQVTEINISTFAPASNNVIAEMEKVNSYVRLMYLPDFTCSRFLM